MNFLRMLYHRLRYGAGHAALVIDDQVDALRAALIREIVFTFGLLILGVVVGALINEKVANYIFAFNFFFTGFLLLIIAGRVGVLATLLPAGYDLVRQIVIGFTEWLPFTNGIALPSGVSTETSIKFYRVFWAALVSIQLATAYSVIFPVYRNSMALLVVLGGSWLFLWGALGRGIGGKWLERYFLISIVVGAALIVGYTLTFIEPEIWTKFVKRWDTIWTNFGKMEEMANVNYLIAVVYFTSIIGLLISLGWAIVKKNGRSVSSAVGFLVLFLFLVFLGERTVNAFNNDGGTNDEPTVNGAPNTSRVESTPYSSQGKGQIFVDAKKSNGVDSQVYVKTGATIEISGSGKAVWKNIAVGNPTKLEECGPEGTSPTGSPLLTKAEYMSNISDYLCPTALKGALIAKIGDGSWFPVGASYKGEAKQSGKLILAINDIDPSKQSVSNWQDNDKGFQVTINVK